MRSFNDYIKNRRNIKISEMAAEPVTYTSPTGEKEVVEEVRKTPIFMDKNDIDYLNQFPPQFWIQALLQRYGKLLYQAHEARQQGKKLSDQQTVNVAKGVSFTVDAKIDDLYNKLTHDVDDNFYSKLRNTPKDREEYVRHIQRKKELEGRDLGTYGFVMKGYKRGDVKGKEAGVALGYIEPDVNTIRKSLQRLYKAIQNGWYDAQLPEDYVVQNVKFGKGGRREFGKKQLGRNMPVYPDSKTWTSDQGKKFTSYLPILMPSVAVYTRDLDVHDTFKTAAEHIKRDLDSSNFDDYFKIIDINSPNLLNDAEVKKVKDKLDELNSWLSKNTRSSNEKENKILEKAKLERLRVAAEFISRPKNIKILKSKFEKAAQMPNAVKEIKDIIKTFLERLNSRLEQKAKNIRDASQRHDVHAWNISHFSQQEKNPHTSWSGFGTINVNWQQPEVVHGSLQDILGSDENINKFWTHLIDEMQISKNIQEGLVKKLELMRGSDPVKQAIVKAIYENMDLVVRNATVFFRNKGAQSLLLPYARLYKQKYLENKNVEVGIARALRKVRTFARNQGLNYCQQLLQLHTRLKTPEKWNRYVRPQNPGEGKVTLEDLFRRFYDLHIDDHSRTSHAIDVMRGVVDRAKSTYAPTTQDVQAQASKSRIDDDAMDLANKISEDMPGDGPTARSERQMTKNIILSGLRHLMAQTGKAMSQTGQAALGLFGGMFGKKPEEKKPEESQPQQTEKSKPKGLFGGLFGK